MLKQMKLLLNYLAKLLSLENARPHLRVLGILKISLAKSNGLCFLRDLWCVCGLKGQYLAVSCVVSKEGVFSGSRFTSNEK